MDMYAEDSQMPETDLEEEAEIEIQDGNEQDVSDNKTSTASSSDGVDEVEMCQKLVQSEHVDTADEPEVVLEDFNERTSWDPKNKCYMLKLSERTSIRVFER